MHKPSAYEFACGGIQSFNAGNLRVTIWREHGVYHVRAHEFDGRGRIDWKAFPTLARARKYFGFLIRHLTSETVMP